MEISTEQLERTRSMLGSLPGNKVKAALTNAANRAMITARSVAWEATKQTYTVKRTAFYRDTRIHVYRANNQSISAAVTFSGYLIPLIDFNVKGYRSHEKRGVRLLKAEVLSGLPKDLRHAYKANLGKYGEAIFERLTPARDSSQQLYGPAAAHMIDNPAVLRQMDEAAKDTFDKRLDHEIDRILRGYGT
ncbi:MAG: hypothetical protein J6A19_05120 [Oscillospiraceae bacterium]|nr:hypothetical protein [Oscillospiraceae bacterium]